MSEEILKNYINGKWVLSTTGKFRDVQNPATAEILARVPVSSPAEIIWATLAGMNWLRASVGAMRCPFRIARCTRCQMRA